MPSTELREQIVMQARHVVVKVGSNLMIGDDGGVDVIFLRGIAEQVSELVERGIDVTLVSSGSIGVGQASLGMADRPSDVGVMQAVAALGQSGLMSWWREVFQAKGMHTAQMLLTRSDFEDRKRYLNIRNCISELHQLKAIPIINENDTVSVDEIRLGDNDILAAMVTNAMCADVLVLLTVVDGLSGAEGEVVDYVPSMSEAMVHVRDEKTAFGTGGMQTKLEAARLVTDAGEVAVIASGREKNVLTRLIDGEKIGTVFVPAERKLGSRDRWIGMTVRPVGVITVDDGAAKAVTKGGKSLLARGITEITGQFGKGDVVVVRDGRGREVARGLINYDADEGRKIMGHLSSDFEKLLGRQAYDEVIHCDNMVLSVIR